MLPYDILYTNPFLIVAGVLLFVFSEKVASFMGIALKNSFKDASNPFVYKVIGVIIVITSLVGIFIFR